MDPEVAALEEEERIDSDRAQAMLAAGVDPTEAVERCTYEAAGRAVQADHTLMSGRVLDASNLVESLADASRDPDQMVDDEERGLRMTLSQLAMEEANRRSASPTAASPQRAPSVSNAPSSSNGLSSAALKDTDEGESASAKTQRASGPNLGGGAENESPEIVVARSESEDLKAGVSKALREAGIFIPNTRSIGIEEDDPGRVSAAHDDSTAGFLSPAPAVAARDPVSNDVETGSLQRRVSSMSTVAAEELAKFDAAVLKKFYTSARGIIFPDNKYVLYWDLFILVLICFIVMYVPFQVGVSNGQMLYQEGYAFLLGTFINIVFIADIVLNFYRAYFMRNGRIVFNRNRVRWHYLTGWFLIDLVACFPVDALYRFLPNSFINNSSGVNFLSFINLFRVFRVNRAFKIVSQNTRLLDFRLRFFTYWTEMLRIVVYLVVYGHWIGCLFNFVALLEAGSFQAEAMLNPEHPNWLQVYYETGGFVPVVGNSFEAIWGRYTLGLYWAFTTTTSIGYGDITPKTEGEIWYVTIIMLSAGLVWSWVIGQMISLVEEMNRNKILFRGRLVQLNNLVLHFQEDKPNIARDARLFLERQYRTSKGRRDGLKLSQIAPVLEHLPPRLRNRVCLALTHRDLMQVTYFRDPSIGIHTLGGIASLCETHQFDSGEVLFLERDGPASRRGVYILRSGVMAVVHDAGREKSPMRVFCHNGVLMHDTVLLPKRSKLIPELTTVAFMTYTEVLFVPRRAVKAVFDIHPLAWRRSARWCAVRANFRSWARSVLGRKSALNLSKSARFDINQFAEADSDGDETRKGGLTDDENNV